MEENYLKTSMSMDISSISNICDENDSILITSGLSSISLLGKIQIFITKAKKKQ